MPATPAWPIRLPLVASAVSLLASGTLTNLGGPGRGDELPPSDPNAWVVSGVDVGQNPVSGMKHPAH